MRKLKNQLLINYILLLTIGIIWGSQFIFNKIAVSTLPPLTIATVRIFFGLVTITILSSFIHKEKKNTQNICKTPWFYYALISLFEAILPFFLVAWGQQRVSSAVAAILMGTVPIFTIILANFYVKGESFKLGNILSVVTGFLGIIILINPSSQTFHGSFLGEMAILLGSISFSISIIILKRLRLNSPVIAVRNILFIAAIPMFIMTMILNQPWKLNFNISAIMALLILGVFCAGVVYVMYIILIERAGATFTSLTNYLVPVFGVLFAYILGKEALYGHEILALLLIIFSLIINSIPYRDIFSR